MRALDDPNSTISVFLREHLPNTELCLHLWRRDLQRHSKRYQCALGITGSIIGRAIEMRIGFDLSPHPVYTDMTSMLPNGQEAELWSMLGYHPTLTGELVRDTERVTSLYANNIEAEKEILHQFLRISRVEDLQQQLGRRRQFDPTLHAGLFKLLNEHPIDPESTNALISLWQHYLSRGRREHEKLGTPVTIRPSFAQGFAVGDLVAGQTLIDIKLSNDSEKRIPEWLPQILGYALCDQDDRYDIRAIGIYHAREAFLKTWPLNELLDELAGKTANLTELRDQFGELVRQEQAVIDSRHAT